MDNEQANRLNEKDKQDFLNRFQNASDNGKGILNMLLSAFIANHDSKFAAQNLEPPSIIDNYKIDTSSYRLELDKEFEDRLSRINDDQSEMRNIYQTSSPEEKVIANQALVLMVEMLKQEIKPLIRDKMKLCRPEELEELKRIMPFHLPELPYRIQEKELNEMFEQIEREENLGVQRKFEEVKEKKIEELAFKYHDPPTQSRSYYTSEIESKPQTFEQWKPQAYTIEEPKRVEPWNTKTTVIKESSLQSYTIPDNQWKPQRYDQWKPATYEEPKKVEPWNNGVPIKEERTIVTERVITMEEWNARQRNQQIQPVTSNHQYDQRSLVFSDLVLQGMIFNRPTPLN